MLPIVSIGNFFSFLSYLFVTIVTYLSYRKKRFEFTFYFLMAFIFVTIWFFIISFPGILLNDPILVGLDSLISYILVYPLMASFVIIILRSLNLLKFTNIILSLFLILLVFTIYVGIVSFKPSHLVIEGDFTYWLSGVKPIIRILIGLVSCFFGLLFVISFFITGIRSGEKRTLIRALILGGGMLSLITASFLNYVAGVYPSPIVLVGASPFAILSAFLFLAGVLYKIEKPPLRTTI